VVVLVILHQPHQHKAQTVAVLETYQVHILLVALAVDLVVTLTVLQTVLLELLLPTQVAVVVVVQALLEVLVALAVVVMEEQQALVLHQLQELPTLVVAVVGVEEPLDLAQVELVVLV
jgi:hypothetical protein